MAHQSGTPVQIGWRRWWKPLSIGFAAIVLNVLAFFMLPPSLVARLGVLGYLGAFAVAAIANATVFLPVPYYPMIARLAQVLNVWGVIFSAAAGSALGESVAFLVGRSSKGIVEKTTFNSWMDRQLRHHWRAGLVLFALSAPPNPAFDVAGLLAGALGVPLWLFLVSVFVGRIIRMSLVAFGGIVLEWI